MKKHRFLLVLVLAVIIITGGAGTAQAFLPRTYALRASNYYTWGIDPREVSIPDGYIITDALVTLYGLTSVSDSSLSSLAIYVLDDPPVGFCENADMPGVDHLAPHGFRLLPDYTDRVKGHETLNLHPSSINNPVSWVWRIYGRPFSCPLADGRSAVLSSGMLELIDYVGNATPFGIGLDPSGAGDFFMTGISLTLTLQTFQGTPGTKQLRFTFGDDNRPPVLSPPPSRVITEGTTINMTFDAVDPEGSTVQFSCEDLPPGATLVDGLFSWTPSSDASSQGAAPYSITITASDGALSTSCTFVIWVYNVDNRAPLLLGLTQMPSEDRTQLLYRINATDPDGDVLTCTAENLPPGAVLDSQTRTIRCDTATVESGTYNITMTVSDGSLQDTATLPLEINLMERSVLTDRQSSLRTR